MSQGSQSHGGMNEHTTMPLHAATAQNSAMDHQGGHDSHGGGHDEKAGHVTMFHLRTDLNLLFEPWNISSTKVLVGSCIAVLFISILHEGLKLFRARRMHMLKKMVTQTEQATGVVQMFESRQGCWTNMCSVHHLSQTILHVVQVVLGYLLMLVVMTYQVYLGVAVIIGAGLGYFFFAGLISDTVPRPPLSSPSPTPENPVLVLNVTNFKDLEEKQHQPEKSSSPDFSISNKGFDMANNDACK